MTQTNSISLVINAVGHCAGALAFGLLLYLVLRSRRSTYRADKLVTAAASLAFIWNAGSLLSITLADWPSRAVDLTILVSFSALSFLPAVLLHVAVPERPLFWRAGYLISIVAAALHAMELAQPDMRFHSLALALITGGFGFLTLASVAGQWRAPATKHSAGRLASAMCLFLLAVSFVHFGPGHARQAWSSEIALHHAGIPLAMIILLRDYRFLLFDAFLRLAVDGALALAAAFGVFELARLVDPLSNTANPGLSVLALIAGSLMLGLFVQLRERARLAVTHWLFVQPDVDAVSERLRAACRDSASEDDFLKAAGAEIARAFESTQWSFAASTPADSGGGKPRPARGAPDWAEAVAPIRLPSGAPCMLLLGPRSSRRRYFSEDYETLDVLAGVVHDEMARMRDVEARRLMSQAELRALQAQINPHFLFNALNTIYGLISRENAVARKLVLHLSELFRSFFRPERMLIPVEEELRIVRAYLEIEQARLGPKLVVDIDVDGHLDGFTIPSLCIQPLVENAVKHGAARRGDGGTVRLAVRAVENRLRVEVTNSGEFHRGAGESEGVGLANVRRRLELWYGSNSEVRVETGDGRTRVSFEIPAANAVSAGGGGQSAHRLDRSVDG
ncbi:MAG: histidine kinase [Acidobacteria bacterium]|nr:histidine kinase [Acidobacteriota bacterium]